MSDLIHTAVADTMRRFGLDGVGLDEQGELSLDVEGRALVLSRSDDPVAALWVQISLGNLPDGEDAARFLLAVAFECWTSGRMTVGIDAETGDVWGGTVLPVATLNADGLEAMLAALIEASDPVAQRIEANDFHLPALNEDAPQPDAAMRV